jgi:hypothetical protein
VGSVASIVEGQGDVASIPIIIRRIAEREGRADVRVLRPYRIPRQTIVRPGEIERAVDRAARSLDGPGCVLVVLDADDDRPCQLGPSLAGRAGTSRRDIPSAVVIANREKEAWYLAAVESLRGKRGIPEDVTVPPNPEGIRGAKGWLTRAMGRSYSEVTDQPALAALFDLDQARGGAPSFDKLWRDLSRLLAAV